MVLLLIYLAGALAFSFLCSLAEAAILSVPLAHARYLAEQGRGAGRHLEEMKNKIDRPLSAILTINTVSHTVGAGLVGAQASVVFGDAWVGATMGVVTVLILVLSEIVPKTLGATYCRPLAPLVVGVIRVMIWTTYPVILLLDRLNNLLKSGGSHDAVTREQLAIVAEIAGDDGQIDPAESELIRNALRLRDIRVRDVLTPRTVVSTAPADATVGEIAAGEGFGRFTRIPLIHDEAPVGVVLRHAVYEELLSGRPGTIARDLARQLHVVPDSARLNDVMLRFGETGHHMFQVVDEHGTFEGVITLEDVLESMLGREIIDETDPVEDMRDLAALRASESETDDR
ncbi:MAG: CNNM domain-containing protein [Planctomycetota bacterium]